MPPSLDGALLKLRRGKDHADALKTAIEASGESITVATNFDADGRRVSAWIERVPATPPEWSLLLGDSVANLRAALDYLVYELVALDNGGVYDEETQFPIADCENRLTRRDRHTLGLLKTCHRAAIEGHQPYKRTNEFRHPLAVLRDMSNQDKHRLLVGTYTGITITRLELWGDDCRVGDHSHVVGVHVSPLEPGTELFSVPVEVVGPKPKMHMNIDFASFVSFAQGRDVSKVIDLLGAKVAEVLREFEPVF